MKKLNLLLIIFTLCQLLSAQNSVYPGVPYTSLQQIAAGADHIVAAGNCGSGIASTDGGDTWTYFSIPNDDYVREAVMIPQSGNSAAYLYSNNNLYKYVFASNTLIALDVSDIDNFGQFKGMVVDNDNIYMISVGAIQKANHNDLVWSKVNDVIYDENYSITASSIQGDLIYIASTEGHIFTSHINDGGYELLVNLANRISVIGMTSNNVGYLTMQGQSGPMKTVDGGLNWTAVSGWPENNPVTVYNEDIFVTTNTNRYFVSTDGGETVTRVDSGNDPTLDLIQDTYFTEDGKIYMCGRSSTVIKSEDFGFNFDNINQYNRSTITDIEVEMEGRGVAVANRLILGTNDGGTTWSEVGTPNLYLNGVSLMNDNKMMIAHDEGVTVMEGDTELSTNGASSYRVYYNKEKEYALTVFEIGMSDVIAKSTDDGLTWTNKFFYSGYLGKIKINKNGLLYLAGVDGQYLTSNDEGENWNEIQLPVEGFMIDLIIDGDFGLISMGNKLYQTTNGGESVIQIETGNRIGNIFVVEPDHYIYSTISSGSTHVREKKPNEQFKTVASWCGESLVSSLANDIIWYGAKGGHIFKYKVDLISGVEDANISNFDIAPNLVKVGTPIQLSLTSSDNSIQLLDNYGNTIANSVSISLDHTINTADLSAGIYHVVIRSKEEVKTARIALF